MWVRPVQRLGHVWRWPLARPRAPAFRQAFERLDFQERADLEHLLTLDADDEDRYERLATDYPEEDGDATRH